MDMLNPECAAQSVGPANQLFGLLIQTILAAQCAISPKDMWPKDYGPTAVEQGECCFLVLLLCCQAFDSIRMHCGICSRIAGQ